MAEENKNMSYNDDDEVEPGLKVDADGDEPLDMLDSVNDFGLDEEDPDKDR